MSDRFRLRRRVGLSSGELTALRDLQLSDRWATAVRDRLAEAVEAHTELVDLATEVLSGASAARGRLRERLLSGLPADPDRVAAGALSMAGMRGEPPTGTLADDVGALIAAAVQVAATPGEAWAFLLLASSAADDLEAGRQLLTMARQGQLGGIGGPGGLGGLGRPGGLGGFRPPPDGGDGRPLRLPPGFPIPEVVPPDGIRWPSEDLREYPAVVFEGRGCRALLASLVAAASSAGTQYRIDRISPDDACGYEGVELFGEGFGDQPGEVVFTHRRGGVLAVRAADWSPTHLRVIVPDDAASGPVGLAILTRTVTVCGVSEPVFQGGQDIEFFGGVPLIRSFAFEADDAGMVDVGRPVVVRWDTLPAARAGAGTVQLDVIEEGGSVLTTRPRLPGGPGREEIDLSGLQRAQPVRAFLTVTNRCDTVRSEITALATRDPGLSVASIELTQGIQSAAGNESVLVRDRNVAARIYARTDLTTFDWGLGAGRCPVTAVVDHAGRIHTVHAVVEPVTSPDDPLSSVTVTLPAADITGSGNVVAELTTDVAAAPRIGVHRASALAAVRVDQTVHRRRTVVLVRVGHESRSHPIPTRQDFLDLWPAAYARLPFGVDQWRLHRMSPSLMVPVGADLLNPGTDKDEIERVRANWTILMEAVQLAAADLADDADLVIGLIPNDTAYLLNGLASWKTRPQALLCQSGLGATLAHEIAHILYQGHTLFPNDGSASVPPKADMDEPTHTDHAGWDLSTGRPVPTNAPDLMSYGNPRPGRWPTRERWERLKAAM